MPVKVSVEFKSEFLVIKRPKVIKVVTLAIDVAVTLTMTHTSSYSSCSSFTQF
jgi:hypothetical protein